MLKKWTRFVNVLRKISLIGLYNREKNGVKWRHELQQSKNKLQDHARQIADEMLRKKEKKLVKTLQQNLPIRKFQEFSCSVNNGFNTRKKKKFVSGDA